MRGAARFLALATVLGLVVSSATIGAWSPVAPDGLEVEVGVKMKTRDGVALVADIYRPAAPGRFPTLLAVVQHYNAVFSLNLTAQQMNDLVEYLKSL